MGFNSGFRGLNNSQSQSGRVWRRQTFLPLSGTEIPLLQPV